MSKDLTWAPDKMAKLIDVTPRRLRQLAEEGIVPKSGRAQYQPFQVTVAYIRYLRDRVQLPDESMTELAVERLGKTRAERELLEIELAKERSELIPVGDVYELLEGCFIAIRSRITYSHLSDSEKDDLLLQLNALRDHDLCKLGREALVAEFRAGTVAAAG